MDNISLKPDLEVDLDETSAAVRSQAEALKERARAAARYADDYVHDQPWVMMAAAAGIGFAVGLLIGRRL